MDTKICPVLTVQELLGRKWTVLLLEELYDKQKVNFNHLLTTVKPITNKVLANRLQQLEEQDIVHRSVIQDKPLLVHYSLTQKGNDFVEACKALKKWGTTYNLTPVGCKDNNCNNCVNKECFFTSR